MPADPHLRADIMEDIRLSYLAGMGTTVPDRREEFADLTSDLPMGEVFTGALCLTIHLALAHFTRDVAASSTKDC